MANPNELEVPENWDTLDNATRRQWVQHWDQLIESEVRANQEAKLIASYARNTAQQAARQEQQRQTHNKTVMEQQEAANARRRFNMPRGMTEAEKEEAQLAESISRHATAMHAQGRL